MPFDLEPFESRENGGNGSMNLATQTYRIIELKRDDPESVALLLSFVDRCLAFCEKYHTDVLPDVLRSNIFAAFQTKSEAWKLLVAVDDAGKIVAHCIADIEQYGLLGNVVYILQIEKDVTAEDVMSGGFKILKEWAAKYKIKPVLNMALSEAHARLYEKEYGFKTYRWLMKLDAE